MKVGVTCIQLIRDLEQWRTVLSAAGLEPVVPEISGQHIEGDDLVGALEDCVGVIAGDDQFTRQVLERLPSLKAISKWGIGVDGIDRAAAADLGIEVRNTPGMFDDEVGDVTMAYITILARELVQIDRRVRNSDWYKPAGTSLRNSTLGIVGFGGIGRATAARALAAGMRVLGTDPSEDSRRLAQALGATPVELDEVLSDADFIAITCPLNDATFHLFDDASFDKVRPGVRIVNTGRGAVIDNEALVRALADGRVGGAALDVMEAEPLPESSPLAQFEQVVLGSHNASNTLEASARVHRRAIDNLIEALHGGD